MVKFMGGLIRTMVVWGLLNVVVAQALAMNPLPDTGQATCYDRSGTMDCPDAGEAFFGQDAHYRGNAMAYENNGNGTVTDQVTGLTWSRAVDAKKVSLDEARILARQLRLGGHRDWRVPNIKELYSLMDFRGYTGAVRPGQNGRVPGAIPFINTDYFNFKYGDTGKGERFIDAQWLSTTTYVSTTMDGNPTLFGVNFADGRIKGYGYGRSRGPRGEKKFYVRFVRGPAFGENDFQDNGDNTITDTTTGLMWARQDSVKPMSWEKALAWAEASTLAGYTDWRLPNAKELQFIVDYTRSPDTTDSPALDPIFKATPIKNEIGRRDFAHYWTSTTHLDGPRPGNSAVTICFGRALGKMHGRVMDVHGAGAQRSDPKAGKDRLGRGPQGDARRGRNMVRLVRGGGVVPDPMPRKSQGRGYPFRVQVDSGFDARVTGREWSEPDPHKGVRHHRIKGGVNVGGGPEHGPPGRDAFIQRLDRDGDRRVSPAEFDGPARHFNVFDRNSDGYISRDEAPTGAPLGMTPP